MISKSSVILSSESIRYLAALIFAEATPVHGVSSEMLNIGYTVRNRLEWSQKHAADAKWFGTGDYRTVIEHKIGSAFQFQSVGGNRFQNFLADRIDSSPDHQWADCCVEAATTVANRPNSMYPYVWFQRGNKRPSPRASAIGTYIGSHFFWSIIK